jgi:hypothetical protein
MTSIMHRKDGSSAHCVVTWRDPTTVQLKRKAFHAKADALAFRNTVRTQHHQHITPGK